MKIQKMQTWERLKGKSKGLVKIKQS